MAALAACTITATPAKAHHPEYAPQIINYLQRLGVKLYLNSRDCGPSKNGYAAPAGWYRPTTNEMCLKDHSIIGADGWYRILTHEAWHAFQDGLAGGIHTSRMISLSAQTYDTKGKAEMERVVSAFKSINNNDTLSWAREYAGRQRNGTNYTLEWEAVMVEHHPDYVLNSLKFICQNTPGC